MRRQHSEPSVTEMLLMIHSRSHIDNTQQQRGLSSHRQAVRAQAVNDLAEDIAGEIERVLGLHTKYYENN